MIEGYGLPVDGGASWKAALRQFVLEPSGVAWEELAHKIIPHARGRTMWQAWLAVDPSAPRSLPSLGDGADSADWGARWPTLPSPFLLRQMIERAQERRLSNREFMELLR